MSRENVELVRRLQPASDVDLAALFRDDQQWAGMIARVGTFFAPDLESVLVTGLGHTPYSGLDGLRATWLDWLAPWATYRTEIDDCIDAGDRVVVMAHDFARRTTSDAEVDFFGAAVWTVHGSRIARIEFNPNRPQAMKELGLAGT